ncbi:MAG: hypothetical protein V4692_02670 [Bdellovibrionota bacterium]
MNRIVKVLAVATAALALSACDEIGGTLSVSKPIVLKLKKEKTLTLAPGSYKTSIEVDSKDRQIEVEVKVGEKKQKTKIVIPGSKPLPTRNGSLEMSAQELGQAFGLSGEVQTDVDYSSPTRAVESCTYTIQRRECETVIHPDGRRERVCRIRDVSVSGRQNVEYHHQYTTVTAQMRFLNASSGKIDAQFDGSEHSSSKIYDYVGECR